MQYTIVPRISPIGNRKKSCYEQNGGWSRKTSEPFGARTSAAAVRSKIFFLFDIGTDNGSELHHVDGLPFLHAGEVGHFAAGFCF